MSVVQQQQKRLADDDEEDGGIQGRRSSRNNVAPGGQKKRPFSVVRSSFRFYINIYLTLFTRKNAAEQIRLVIYPRDRFHDGFFGPAPENLHAIKAANFVGIFSKIAFFENFARAYLFRCMLMLYLT